MEFSGFLSQFLREVSLPRLTPTEPPPNPELIAKVRAANDTEIAPGAPHSAACLRSLFLLGAGDLDGAHVIVQDLTSSNAAYIHGMIHRVEGDFGNARYWFNRAQVHPTAAEIYRRAAVNSLRIAALSVWDPAVVTDMAEVARRTGPSDELKTVLAIEYEVLIEHLANPQNEQSV
jgi:hypothetical protein